MQWAEGAVVVDLPRKDLRMAESREDDELREGRREEDGCKNVCDGRYSLDVGGEEGNWRKSLVLDWMQSWK